jgi:hypothetical protein
VRPPARLAWQQVVVSLQTLLANDLVVGGRTALELHGYVHYLKSAATDVYLYGPKPPPTCGAANHSCILFPTAANASHRSANRTKDDRVMPRSQSMPQGNCQSSYEIAGSQISAKMVGSTWMR